MNPHGLNDHRYLKPARLPIPPLLHNYILAFRPVDGGGFEPPKQFAADLQSVPFGHSGIHPYIVYEIVRYRADITNTKPMIGLEPITC